MSEAMNGHEETPHVTSFRRQDKLKRIAAKSFRVVNGRAGKPNTILSATEAESAVAAVVATDKIDNARPGDLIAGKGVFLGRLTVRDAKDSLLSKTFNVYAAPEDLVDAAENRVFTYSEAVSQVAGLKDWHGHDGACYATDREIFKALEDGSYDGSWVIPPRDLVRSVPNGERFLTDTLYAHQNTGAFKGTFHTKKGVEWREMYWSSTFLERDAFRTAWLRLATRFSDGFSAFYEGEGIHCACRPIRLEQKTRAPQP